MKQLANVNTQEIAEVEFVFENCECCTVPIECFKELSIKPLEKYHDDELGKEYQICEVNFHVVDNCQIEMDLYTHDSFTQRVAKRHDIAQIIIEHTDGRQTNILPVWYEVKNGVLWGDTYENGEIYKVVTVGLDNLDIIKGQFIKVD